MTPRSSLRGRDHRTLGPTDVAAALVESLGPVEQQALVERLRLRRFQRGQVVCNHGDHGDCLYLVKSGRLEVQVSTSEGRLFTLRVVHPGEMVGELALVHPDHQRSGRVSALESAELFVLHRADFDELRAQHPGVDRFLVGALAERLKRTSDLVVEMLLPAETRVWRRLAVLADAYGDEPMRLSQDVLAHAAGTVRQTASRVLQVGVRQGVLAVDRGSIRVLDRDAVERFADL